jgi:hypothetical protein
MRRQHLNVQRFDARTSAGQFKSGWMIVPADGTGRCKLDEAATSVRRHFLRSSEKSLTSPYFLNRIVDAKHNGNARTQPSVAVISLACRSTVAGS